MEHKSHPIIYEHQLKYCEKCDTVFCEKCQEEWKKQIYNWSIPVNNWSGGSTWTCQQKTD